jgi:hypothetical protein
MRIERIKWVVVVLALILGGCSTRPNMAFEKDDAPIETGKAILLMTVTLKNSYRPGHPLRLFAATVDKRHPREVADRFVFDMDDKGKRETNTPEQGNTYLLRMPFDPGSYVFQGLVSRAGPCPLLCGQFFVPLQLPLEAKTTGIVYIGHVDATARERQGDEFRAGYVVPLIDQAATGASGGSFDVEVSDRFATDEAMFRNQFPALKTAEISKSLLSPFTRTAAQKWWAQPGLEPYFLLHVPGRRCNSCGAPNPTPP